MTEHYIETKVLIIHDDSGMWTAQGLEYDVCAQGTTMELAMKDFDREMIKEVCLAEHFYKDEEDPVSKIPQAPDYILNFWNELSSFRSREMRPTKTFFPENAFVSKKSVPILCCS